MSSVQIEEIKNRVDVVDFIGTYLRLEKAGANFRACCPFHGEKTPSFIVSPARQIWHCFGCGKGGDVFKFYMEIEGQEFPDALRALAERAGVEIKREDPAIRSERQRSIALQEEAASFFESKLWTEDRVTHPQERDDISFSPSLIIREGAGGGLASPLVYLRKRGLADETIKEFRLGFAPEEWRELSTHLKQKGFSDSEIEKSGLVIKSQTNKFAGSNYYDRFRGRIMFPISDQSGRVIAFGGRVFGEKPNEAKYVNSPETSLYQKSKVLYGLNKSKTEILRVAECIVVEGYMDMIMAYQAGTKNVVASSGTALTTEHIKILKRFCDKLIAAFDMDVAGESASKRGIDLALKENFSVRVLKLDGVKDPADAVLQGPEVWQSSVVNSRHIVQFFIDSAISKYGGGTPELSREVQKSVLPIVSSLSSDLERAHWVREVSNVLNIKEEIIWAALPKNTNIGASVEVLAPDAKRSRKELLEDRVLGMAASHPNFLTMPNFSLNDAFFSQSRKAVFAEIKLAGSGSQSPAVLKDFISRLILEADLFSEKVEDVEAEFLKCRRELEREYLKEKMGRLAQDIHLAEQNKGQGLNKLVLEFQEVSKKLSQLN